MKNLIYKVWKFIPNIFKNLILKILLKLNFKKVIFDGKITIKIFDILNKKIKIGENTFIGENSKIFADNNNIIIGKYCSIASDFYAITKNHSTKYISYHINQYKKIIDLNHEKKTGDIIIGNDVWIGNRVTVLPGIKIGNGAIIGAGAIVTKDVESYSIVGGNPAKQIKKRFSNKEIKYLENLKWWNWSESKIKENEKLFNTKLSEIKY